MVFLSNAHKDSELDKVAHPGHSKAEATAGKKLDAAINSFQHSTYDNVYGSLWAAKDMPRYEMPENEMPPRIAYKLIHDELALDSNPYLNLASFVTTYMEPECEKLMMENLSKNFIDFEEYPAACEIQNRAVNMIARLFNAPTQNDGVPESIGVSTVGSSEAIILSVLAMKKRWQAKQRALGKSTENPNLVMGANVQVCWEKAVKYLDVEERFVYCTEERYIIDPQDAVNLVDENTIGVCAIFGSTYTGEYEDVKMLSELLEVKNKEFGFEDKDRIMIHVDAASGGFVAPFVKPDLEWDFRVPLVCSINTSGHKYGLVYPGVGWAFWRSNDYLPQELVFNINYLGAEQASFTLNFSKSASNVIAQYYILIRLGKAGFTAIMQNLTCFGDYLSETLEASGKFIIMSARNGNGLPLVAFRLKKKNLKYDEFDVAARLREKGWILPAYTMAPNASRLKMLRIVIREDFTRHRCDLLVHDILSAIEQLDTLDLKTMEARRAVSNNWNTVVSKWRSLKQIPADESLASKHGKTNAPC